MPDSLLPTALNEGACKIDAYLDSHADGAAAEHTKQVTGTPVMTGRADPKATKKCRS